LFITNHVQLHYLFAEFTVNLILENSKFILICIFSERQLWYMYTPLFADIAICLLQHLLFITRDSKPGRQFLNPGFGLQLCSVEDQRTMYTSCTCFIFHL